MDNRNFKNSFKPKLNSTRRKESTNTNEGIAYRKNEHSSKEFVGKKEGAEDKQTHKYMDEEEKATEEADAMEEKELDVSSDDETDIQDESLNSSESIDINFLEEIASHDEEDNQSGSSNEEEEEEEEELGSSTLNPPNVPEEFICPISKNVMEYPYTTSVGNTYEYSCIAKWLLDHNTDPLTNTVLHSKRIFPNNNFRSQILSWFERHPEVEDKRNKGADKPPSPQETQNSSDNENLDKILLYKGKKKMTHKEKGKITCPIPFSAFGHKYNFKVEEEAIKLQCDDGDWIDSPDVAMFVTASGVVFYDPTEYLPVQTLTALGTTKPCRKKNWCLDSSCKFAHPFVCKEGVECASVRKCKFLHPDETSITEHPKGKKCKFGTSCESNTCKLSHLKGRMTVEKHLAKVLITHSLELKELMVPISLPLEIPPRTTCFQFQGEFIFFFQPYPGPWAKKHFQNVHIYRFDNSKNLHKFLGVYSLAGHYCNSIAGAKRYMVISFWPYEEEAIRTIWECCKTTKKTEKDLQFARDKIVQLQNSEAFYKLKIVNLYKDITTKQSIIDRQRTKFQEMAKKKQDRIDKMQGIIDQKQRRIDKLQGIIDRLQKKVAKEKAASYYARQETHQVRKQLQHANYNAKQDQERIFAFEKAKERALRAAQKQKETAQKYQRMLNKSKYERRNERFRLEKARNERFRNRDPIQIFTLSNGNGSMKSDWTMVVDYHKGAHNIKLSEHEINNSQALEITEHDKVFLFELVAPENLDALGVEFPIVPKKLCPGF